MESLDNYISRSAEWGALSVTAISPAAVVTEAWTVMKCRYGCPMYGRNRCCPPYSPDWQQMRQILQCYHMAFLLGSDSLEGAAAAAVACARQLVADGYYKALAFGAGPCRRCSVCTPESCPHPDEAIPSMEACGIDVVATVRNAGLTIRVPPIPGDALHCYGLVLVQ